MAVEYQFLGFGLAGLFICGQIRVAEPALDRDGLDRFATERAGFRISSDIRHGVFGHGVAISSDYIASRSERF
jgi:hypothetical protein